MTEYMDNQEPEQQDQLPNGFTGFANQDPGFESAANAMRRSRVAQEAAAHIPPSAHDKEAAERRAAQAQGAQAGWQALSPSAALEAKAARETREKSLWSIPTEFSPASIRRYLCSTEAGVAGPDFNYLTLAEIPEVERRWSWVQVDIAAIQHNTIAVKQKLQPGVKLMAVVKADAYGHGAVRCAKTALAAGADYLGVATVDEAIELRSAGIGAPLLVLAEPPATSIPLLLAYRIMPSVYTAEFAIQYAEAADTIGLRAPYHLKVNTGMNRIGVRYDEVIDFLRRVSFHRALDLVGTFTHFATADVADTMEFNIQVSHFVETIKEMRSYGIDPGIVHAANSAAIIRFPEVHFDMVRLGISLYGYYPCPETYGLIDLIPAMSVHARITQVKSVPVGEGVSYGLLYRSGGYSKVCTMPIGYADGYRRGLSDRTHVVYGGIKCPQVGTICMDQSMFEVDLRTRRSAGKADPQIGDEVMVVGAMGNAIVTIDEMADALSTVPHEICIGFGTSRLPRFYTS